MNSRDDGSDKERRPLCHGLEQELDCDIGVEVGCTKACQLLVSENVVVGISFEVASMVICFDQVLGDCTAFCDDPTICCDQLWCFAQWMRLLKLGSSSTFVFPGLDTVVILQVVVDLEFFN